MTGLITGWILATLTSSNKSIKNLMMSCMAYSNTTAIPLVFASLLGDSSITKDDPHFKRNATNYVLIYTVFVTVYK